MCGADKSRNAIDRLYDPAQCIQLERRIGEKSQRAEFRLAENRHSAGIQERVRVKQYFRLLEITACDLKCRRMILVRAKQRDLDSAFLVLVVLV